MTLEDIVERAPEVDDAAAVAGRDSVVEVRDLSKTFEIPLERIDSLKERALRPFAHQRTRRLEALRGISFDVHRGEFFGIVGRNGTGKSTLLKILASIYRADAGTIRMAGRAAPFIELGVGFNHELTARENVALNGVMMGLSRREAAAQLDAVLDFAELQEFRDLKLKNYSSGMLVRLAFSVMIQSDADVLLIDEVLAVGDASFQQKCKDVFHDIRSSDRTVILVTHDMSAVEQYCHRAMLLHDGDIAAIGDPNEVAQRYLRLNFAQDPETGTPLSDVEAQIHLIDAWLETESGERTANVEQFQPITLHAIFEASGRITDPSFGFMLANIDGVEVSGFGRGLSGMPDGTVVEADERVHVSATLDNRLAQGRYVVQAYAHANRSLSEPLLGLPRILDFVVYGTGHSVGVASLFSDTSAVKEER
jgi:ABC-2 type transport system ATP-binding protein